jgi:hypothetical protein
MFHLLLLLCGVRGIAVIHTQHREGDHSLKIFFHRRAW